MNSKSIGVSVDLSGRKRYVMACRYSAAQHSRRSKNTRAGTGPQGQSERPRWWSTQEFVARLRSARKRVHHVNAALVQASGAFAPSTVVSTTRTTSATRPHFSPAFACHVLCTPAVHPETPRILSQTTDTVCISACSSDTSISSGLERDGTRAPRNRQPGSYGH